VAVTRDRSRSAAAISSVRSPALFRRAARRRTGGWLTHLVVMGGTCQRTWRHAIPKVSSAGPRIALMFRPAWSGDGD
jgi:alkylated DNA repair dioxygenase AlkB